VADEVVPHLAGDRAERLTVAARVTWWSLKEGVLDLGNPVAYSNCNTPSGDFRYGPLDVCYAGRAWQVGLSAVQVPGTSLDQLEGIGQSLFGKPSSEILAMTARHAGFDPSTGTGAAIVQSTGMQRASWLLRNSAIGFTVSEKVITAECINDAYYWCYGTGWDTSAWYAPYRGAAFQSIDDLYAILDALAP
jgi:hypothetical protein